MNIEKLGLLLSNYTEMISILDTQGNVLWSSSKIESKLLSNIASADEFEETMKELANDFIEDSISEIQFADEKYEAKGRWVKIARNDCLVISLKSLNSLDDYEIKCYALESILESINDGVILSDYKGKISLYNNSMEKLEDKNTEDMVAHYLWDAYGYRIEEDSEHREVFYSGKPKLNQYKAHSYSDGVARYVSYSTYPILKAGEKIGVFTISKNETKLHNLLAETVELKRKFLNEKKEIKDVSRMINGTQYTFSDIVGSSDSIKRLIYEAESISWIDSNILIIGETGTGKEVFAQSIHNYGKRKNEPFIGINCSAIPENLLESILFGTVKGAFTGALDQNGLFQEANGGTLFLDEMNSMPISMQTKLLRVIQERVARPVGGNKSYTIQCRIISAMNQDPNELIKLGTFREDLYYRIAGYSLIIPPLNERKKDIMELIDYYINKYNKELNRSVLGLSDELKKFVLEYKWPGNVRQIQNFIENTMIKIEEDSKYLRLSDIPSFMAKKVVSDFGFERIQGNDTSLTITLNNIERRIINETLEKNDWNISKSARELGIIRQSLLYRMKKLDIIKPHSKV